MSMTEERAETLIDDMARRSTPEDVDKVDRQFAEKLRRLQDDEHMSSEAIERLELFWQMLKAPDDIVPWSAKAQIMAALAYFASPLDLIPDLVGKPGYLDDAMIVGIVYRRIKGAVAAFQDHRSRA
jgi:uncharacterized membrane protein YkvA (DUF1232 family)